MDDQYGFAVRGGQQAERGHGPGVVKDPGGWDLCRDAGPLVPQTGGSRSDAANYFRRKNGILNFGTAAVTEPMTYVYANEGVIGFDIEYAAYIAQDLGMQLNIVDMEFGAISPALISGKVDMIGVGIVHWRRKGPERPVFEPYYKGGAGRHGTGKTSASETGKTGKTLGVLLGSTHEEYA